MMPAAATTAIATAMSLAFGTRTEVIFTSSAWSRHRLPRPGRRQGQDDQPGRQPDQDRKRCQGPCQLAADDDDQQPPVLPGGRGVAPEQPPGAEPHRVILQVPVRAAET